MIMHPGATRGRKLAEAFEPEDTSALSEQAMKQHDALMSSVLIGLILDSRERWKLTGFSPTTYTWEA